MARILICLMISVFCIIAFSACMTEEEKADLHSFYEEQSKIAAASSASKKAASSSNADSSNSQSSSSTSQNSASEKNGSTQIDNKPPQKQNNKDGVTIHIPQSSIDQFNSEVSEVIKEFSQKIDDIPVYSYDSNRSDWEYSYPEYSTPDDWKEPYSGGSNPDKYPWEDDANIPEYKSDIPIPEFSGQGEGDTGYSGGTIPNFSTTP